MAAAVRRKATTWGLAESARKNADTCADYLLAKDRLFARVTLDEDEFRLYEQVHEKLAIESPKPDLVVYLQAPVNVLLDRIARGIASNARRAA